MSLIFLIPLVANSLGILVASYFLVRDASQKAYISSGLSWALTLILTLITALAGGLYYTGKSTMATILAWIPLMAIAAFGVITVIFINTRRDVKPS